VGTFRRLEPFLPPRAVRRLIRKRERRTVDSITSQTALMSVDRRVLHRGSPGRRKGYGYFLAKATGFAGLRGPLRERSRCGEWSDIAVAHLRKRAPWRHPEEPAKRASRRI